MNPGELRVTVNGKVRALPRGTRVADLIDPGWGRAVAVARNRDVVPRDSWAETALDEGDEVEIVRPIQGG